MHLVHTFQTYFHKIYSSIIFPSTHRSSEFFHPFRFSNQNLERISHVAHASYMSSHIMFLGFITLIIFDDADKSRSSSLCSPHQPPATSSLLGPNILLCFLFSSNLNLYFSLSMTDQVSHPYKTTGKIIVLYTFICKLLGNGNTKVSEQNSSKNFSNIICF